MQNRPNVIKTEHGSNHSDGRIKVIKPREWGEGSDKIRVRERPEHLRAEGRGRIVDQDIQGNMAQI